MKRCYVGAPTAAFDSVEEAIFALEDAFIVGHPVRQALYRARIEVGKAQMLNRRDKDRLEYEWRHESTKDASAKSQPNQVHQTSPANGKCSPRTPD